MRTTMVLPVAIGAGTAALSGGLKAWSSNITGEGALDGFVVKFAPGTPLAIGGTALTLNAMEAIHARKLSPTGVRLGGAAVAGALLGSWLFGQADRMVHSDEYRRSESDSRAALATAQHAFRKAGLPERVLDDLPVTYDRSLWNAYYSAGGRISGATGFSVRDEVVIGRDLESRRPYSDAPDVLAHEYAHHVINRLVPGAYSTPEAQAMNESLADTLAIVAYPDNWRVGETPNRPDGFRHVDDPAGYGAVVGERVLSAAVHRKDFDPDVDSHLNMGIGNLASAKIGKALGIDQMGRIYVEMLTSGKLHGEQGYQGLADSLREAAAKLHGEASREAAVVDRAWREAGY